MHRLAAALLLCAIGLVWGPGLDLFFWSDDFVLLHYCRATSFGDLLRERLLHGPRSDVASPWWRPGWLVLFNAAYETFGLTPWLHRLTILSLHAGLALALLALARRAGVATPLALAGALLFALAPSYAEALLWVCAGYNVVPAALCLTTAALAYARYVEQGDRRALTLAGASFALSFLFREAGYHMPLVVGVAHLTLSPQGARPATRSTALWRRALAGAGHALPFLAVVVLHNRFLNPFEVSHFTLGENLAQVALQGRQWLSHLFAVPATPRGAWLALAGLAALFAAAPPRGRFALAWALAASFPFVVRAHDTRFAYFVHAPLALAVVATAQRWCSDRSGVARPLRTKLCAAALVALALANALRVAPAIARARSDADADAAFLALAREHGLHERVELQFDFLPPELFSGASELLDLYLGKAPRIVNHALLDQRPPFLIYGNPAFADLAGDTPMLHFDAATRRFAPTTKTALVAGRPLVPLFGFRHRAQVVASWNEVTPTPDLVHLLHLPDPPLALAGTDRCKVVTARGGTVSRLEFDVDAPRDAFLVIAFVGDLLAVGGQAFVDGRAVPLLLADGLFNAVPVRRGSRSVVIKTDL